MYRIAVEEFDSGNADAGIMAKVWFNTEEQSSQSSQKKEYVRLRVEQLKKADRQKIVGSIKTASTPFLKSAASLTMLLLKAAACLVIAAATTFIFSKSEVFELAFAPLVGAVIAITLVSKPIEWAIKKVLRFFTSDQAFQNYRRSSEALIIAIGTAISLTLFYYVFQNSYSNYPGFYSAPRLFICCAITVIAWRLIFLEKTKRQQSSR
ncbi:hypothetical protein BBB39_13070 [Bordetella trematum]|uniref:Uncharacterized protein n=2 Tax=Bordetella trematum TaxID=123899 RepID=A0A157SU72_9BORD|nr:hypothetical protein BBB39_13070 [Bordetella trematum]SAI58639.1 Uncharacterised protein [Bordetella trematum]SAI73881.1 Uncharacterised protein [Bordetella trematum]SUV97154.1 Uncharacterised protein [Bordetella trematum]